MSAISIANLTKVYANGTRALTDINLEIKAGDFFALLGANGAGKTTIIGILTGLVNKTSGNVSVFDFNIDTHITSAKQATGVVPQEMNFNLFEKTQDIVVTQGGYFGISRKEALAESERLLKRLDLWDKRDQVARTLSGGMKRRLMIARALINKPKLLILDEPTAGVDVELRHSMWEYLDELNKQGTTVLLTTHYLEEVERLCRNVAIIKDGKILVNDQVKRLVKMVDDETYVVQVDCVRSLNELGAYNPVEVDEHTFEVALTKREQLHPLLNKIHDLKMTVTDIRPKGNRIEKLYLNILNQKKEPQGAI